MTPVERAKADLVKMRTELGRLQVQVELLDERIRKVESYIEMADFYDGGDATAEATRSRGGGVSAMAVRLTVEVLKVRREPMHTREIIKMLEAKGVSIGGSNPIANLSGFLSRSEELVNSRALGWGLADWGPPPAEASTGGYQQKIEQLTAKIREAHVREQVAPTETTIPPWKSAPDDLDEEIPF